MIGGLFLSYEGVEKISSHTRSTKKLNRAKEAQLELIQTEARSCNILKRKN